ncbi:hypothetical protein BVC80_1819g34 [Macleaya cordata]|uniref:Longin domain n=1 Tax=Macleaya cordata TaxID=56857 RepID=A0A200QW65_MACCD|nr:hypothetical protein BVC80_1819g34 [Macleaya cordata]
MISDPNLILYACVSKGTMILAELTFGDHDLETLALQCLEKTPTLHVTFSQTTANRTYSFLIDDPFVYFAIFKKDNCESDQGLQFLELVKDSFINKILNKNKNKNKSINDLTPHCFHEEFDPIFRGLISTESDELSPINLSPYAFSRDSRNGSLDSRSSGNKVSSTPLLGRSSRWGKNNKKKKRSDEFTDHSDEQVLNSSSSGTNSRREHSQSQSQSQRNGNYYIEEIRHQEAQRRWRENVRMRIPMHY